MNCKPGDLAYVRGTCPCRNIRGVTVTVDEFMGEFEREIDVWHFTFSGPPQIDDWGQSAVGGYIPDRYLVPISGVPVHDEVTDEVTA